MSCARSLRDGRCDSLAHRAPRAVPRRAVEDLPSATLTVGRVLIHGLLDRGDPSMNVVRDPNVSLLAVRPDDVTDRSGDDGLAAGEVLQGLGRADEPRGAVPGERH